MSERTIDSVDQLGGSSHFAAHVKRGGPVSVSSGATTTAITFSTPFPDTDYSLNIEWVSGSNPSYGARSKTVNYCIAQFTQVTENSAFNWRAWRL